MYGAEISVSKESVQKIAETLVGKINVCGTKLKTLFLCDNLLETVQFGFFLYCLTFIGKPKVLNIFITLLSYDACCIILGCLFNLLTLVTIGWVALFTLPKLYTNNQVRTETQYLNF